VAIDSLHLLLADGMSTIWANPIFMLNVNTATQTILSIHAKNKKVEQSQQC